MNRETTKRWVAGCLGVSCLIGVAAWIVCGVTSCGISKPDFSHSWQTDLDSIQNDKAGAIVSYEEKSGEILVSLADSVGDCHVFRLNHPGKSIRETQEILKKKKEEQDRAKSNRVEDAKQQVDSGTNRVTPAFLRAHGFSPTASDPDIFTLKNVRLADVARGLDFSPSDLRPTPSQPIHSDVRIVRIRDLYFVVESEVRDADGNVISGSLAQSNAVCTISVGLKQVVPPELRKER